MIILDTNVVSELMRSQPSERVEGWFKPRAATSLFTTAVTQAEILYGVAWLPAGRRRQELEKAVSEMFDEDFTGRVLPFDSAAAHAYAEIVDARRRAGRPISQFDAQIASIAMSRGAAIATRNVRDFEGCGVDIVDPWAN